MRKIYAVLLLTYLCWGNANAQLDEAYIEPNVVHVGDTVRLIYFGSTPSHPAWIFSNDVEQFGDSVIVKSCIRKGPNSSTAFVDDTINLGTYPPGQHFCLFYYRATHGTVDSACNFGYVLDTAQFLINVLPATHVVKLDKTNFTLHPNPATNTVTIQLPALTTTAQLKLYNTIGEVVLQQTTSQAHTPIDISQLLTGIYFVQVETEKGTVVKRLVVAR